MNLSRVIPTLGRFDFVLSVAMEERNAKRASDFQSPRREFGEFSKNAGRHGFFATDRTFLAPINVLRFTTIYYSLSPTAEKVVRFARNDSKCPVHLFPGERSLLSA